jgi:hypothetical protein
MILNVIIVNDLLSVLVNYDYVYRKYNSVNDSQRVAAGISFHHHIQTSSETHPYSLQSVLGVSLQWDKTGRT